MRMWTMNCGALCGILLAAGCAEHRPASVGASATTRATTRAATTRPAKTPVVAAGSVVRQNIAYVAGGSDKQTLDIYAPAGAKDAPVVIFVHGGEWFKGDKAEVSYKPRFLNDNGIILVSINYRLSGTDQHPAQADDVAAAVRWVHDHAASFGGSPDKLVLMGHSAGCHLVTLVGLDPRPLATVGMRPADLKGVISWSGGAFDLVAKVGQEGMYAKYIRLNFGASPEAWRDASPIAHVGDSKPMPRFLFASAGEGNPESRLLSEQMARLIKAAGGDARAVTLEGKEHYFADHEVGMPGDPTGEVLLRFVRVATSR